MKKIIFGLLTVAFLSQGCLKESDNECTFSESGLTAPTNERNEVKNYLNANSIIATEHPAGVFYKVSAFGSTTSVANLCSNVTVRYSGKLTNGTVFDATPAGQTLTIGLYQVIPAWQKAVALIQAGGIIDIYVPPTLGYGSTPIYDQTTGAVIIPANSVLIFHIELVSIQNQ